MPQRLICAERERGWPNPQQLRWFAAVEVPGEQAATYLQNVDSNEPPPTGSSADGNLQRLGRVVVPHNVIGTLAVEVRDHHVLETVLQAQVERLPRRATAPRDRP